MKPTQVTDLLANIKNTFVSFFSILMFVALGVGIFLGISWAGPALQNAADACFEEGSMHHFQLQYVYGLTDDDVKDLAQVEGVSDVEATRQSFQTTYAADGSRVTAKVQALTSRIDVPTAIEGVLPERTDEIALNAVAAKKLGFGVGDEIAFERDADAEESDPLADVSALDGTDAAPASTAEGGRSSASGEKSADEDGMKYLNDSTFTVTALVDSPEYLADSSATYGFSDKPSGGVDMVAWVGADAFDASAFQDGYPVVDVVCDGLAGLNSFSDAYGEASASLAARIEALGDKLADARFENLHAEAQGKVDAADQKLADAKGEIESGERQLSDGRAELEAKKADGQAKLSSAYAELVQGEELKRQGEAKLSEGRALVGEGEAALAEADGMKAELTTAINDARAFKEEKDAQLARGKVTKRQHDAALDSYGAKLTAKLKRYGDKCGVPVPSTNHENYDAALGVGDLIVEAFEDIPVEYKGETVTVREARKKLDDARRQLAEGEAEYHARVAQLNAGWAQYYAGKDELNQLVAEGERKIADGEKQVADAKELVATNEPKLNGAKEQLAAMKGLNWAVLSRKHNAGYSEVVSFSGVTNRLNFSMATLFVIVGLLVSYSAVSRIVHDQITQIGTKKALGLRAREITAGFLAYSGIAVLAGAVIGTAVGVVAVEGIIGHALGGMFTFGDYPPCFDIVLFLIVTLLELLLVLGATWLACRSILKEHAVELLKGEKPPEGKTRFFEKWQVWDRLPLLTQTIVNNCLNDKRRVFSTVVGVAGCTALIVTAITLNNDTLKSYDYHYQDVYGFNAIAFADAKVDKAVESTEQTLAEANASTTTVLLKNCILTQPDGEWGTLRLIVPGDESEFAKLYHVNPLTEGDYDPSAEGAWVTVAYHEHFGAKVGDSIKLEDRDGAVHDVPILGFYEFWLTYHEAVVGSAYYESEFGTRPSPNVVLANTGDASDEAVREALKGVEGFDSVIDDKSEQYENFETFSKVSSAVVLIYMALSVLMAIVVLLNLNVMFIDEKKRELITLMINGFSVKDAKRYIYNDTIVLTAIGIMLGVALGCIMGSVTVGAIEPSTASFVKGVDWMAVLVGVAGSALLALVMSMIALRRIPKLNLTDINRL